MKKARKAVIISLAFSVMLVSVVNAGIIRVGEKFFLAVDSKAPLTTDVKDDGSGVASMQFKTSLDGVWGEKVDYSDSHNIDMVLPIDFDTSKPVFITGKFWDAVGNVSKEMTTVEGLYIDKAPPYGGIKLKITVTFSVGVQ